MPETLALRTTGVAAGGAAVARDGGGKVIFVEDALPGELVSVELVDEKRSFARGVAAAVLEASEHRVEPPCPHVADGCGGCRWQHVAPAQQPELKRQIVVDALARIGKLGDPETLAGLVGLGEPLVTSGYRTTIRAGVIGGRAGLRHRRSHDVLAHDTCLVAHPLVEELLVNGRFGDATDVSLRAGAATGERLVLASPTAEGVEVPPDVRVVGADQLAAGRRAWFYEEAAGRRWRISATSFFQSRLDGARQLVDVVSAAVAQHAAGARSLVDLCCGVGLFAGAVGEVHGLATIAVERHGAAVHDARHNLSGLGATVVRTGMDGWSPAPADVVVADPARRGLGAKVVRAVAATGAGLVVLVSCDPAALGRDAGLLVAQGYRLERVTLVDLFPHTAEIEAVSVFTRA